MCSALAWSNYLVAKPFVRHDTQALPIRVALSHTFRHLYFDGFVGNFGCVYCSVVSYFWSFDHMFDSSELVVDGLLSLVAFYFVERLCGIFHV